ncbi:MAG: HD domain-containing protein [Elusimicrobiaceae bacterium]
MSEKPKIVQKRPTKDELIASAFYFAVKAHEYQVRKGTGLPYIEHPIKVAALLMEIKASRDLVVAGFLHDVLEDTDRTADEIYRLFGKKVSLLVESVTENKSMSWEERKTHTIKSLEKADYDVVVLSLADKLDNIRSIAADFRQNGERIWLKFSRPKETQRWYYQELVRVLKKRTKNRAEHLWSGEFADLVSRIFK